MMCMCVYTHIQKTKTCIRVDTLDSMHFLDDYMIGKKTNSHK